VIASQLTAVGMEFLITKSRHEHAFTVVAELLQERTEVVVNRCGLSRSFFGSSYEQTVIHPAIATAISAPSMYKENVYICVCVSSSSPAYLRGMHCKYLLLSPMNFAFTKKMIHDTMTWLHD